MLNEFEKKELEKVQQEVRYMELVPENLKANKEFMLEAIKISWCTMYFAAPELKDNEEFVLSAIAIDPDVYMHISDRLKDSEKITSPAIKERHQLYFHASDRLKTDEWFKNNTLKTNSWYPWIKLNKVLKNNFWEGLDDTFSIMYGDYALLKKWNGNEVDPNQLKYGLVDITFIPQLSNTLLNYGMPCTPSVYNPFKYVGLRHNTSILEDISKYLGLGLQFLRFTMAATATIMVLPLVALVHILKSPFIYYYQHQLLLLEGVIYNKNTGEPVSDATTTLAEFASLTDSSLTDLAGFGDDITSYSSKNSEVTRYGSLHSTDPRFFFRPSGGNTPAQIRAQRLVTELEIDEKYSPNDPTSVATGRSFW